MKGNTTKTPLDSRATCSDGKNATSERQLLALASFYDLNPRAYTQLSDIALLSMMVARHLSPMPAQREDLMAILEAADQQSFHRFFDPPAEPASTPSTSPASACQKSTPSHHSHAPHASFALRASPSSITPASSRSQSRSHTPNSPTQPMRSKRPAETPHSSNIFNRTTSPKPHHWSITRPLAPAETREIDRIHLNINMSAHGQSSTVTTKNPPKTRLRLLEACGKASRAQSSVSLRRTWTR